MDSPLPPPKSQSSSTFMTKFKRLWLEQPLVPIGLITTIGFLVAGLTSMRAGNKIRSQMMMRGRILAQGFTLVAMLVAFQSLNSPQTSKTPTVDNSKEQQ